MIDRKTSSSCLTFKLSADIISLKSAKFNSISSSLAARIFSKLNLWFRRPSRILSWYNGLLKPRNYTWYNCGPSFQVWRASNDAQTTWSRSRSLDACLLWGNSNIRQSDRVFDSGQPTAGFSRHSYQLRPPFSYTANLFKCKYSDNFCGTLRPKKRKKNIKNL